MIAMSAGQEAEFGNVTTARQRFASATPSTSHDGMITTTVALAAMGDVAPANKLVDQLNQQFPSDTIIQTYWLPTFRAMLALDRKDPQQALSALGTSLPYELGDQGYWPMCPTYVRGKAYLQAGQGQQAVAEFSKLLRQGGIVKNSPLGAMAQLQLARSQALAGDLGAARVSYQNFLGLWKNADPNVPVFQQAKAEYAKLQ
jgi:tetratricopeptide (TPR) repeat protein